MNLFYEETPSLFFSKNWEKLEKMFGYKIKKYETKNIRAKATIMRSKVLIPKYKFGASILSGSGIGLVINDESDSKKIKEEIKEIFSGINAYVYEIFSNKRIFNSELLKTRILETSKDPLKFIPKKRRNIIKQGYKRGTYVKYDLSPKELAKIITEIKNRYKYYKRKREEVYKILKFTEKKNITKTFVAFKKDVPIGVSVFLLFKNRLTYSISGYEKNYAKFQPLSVIINEALKWGFDNGFKELDLFGGAKKDNNIARFKASFGGKIEIEGHYSRGIKILNFIK